MPVERLLVTPGEPGGIGPDIVCQLAQQAHAFQLCAVADPDMLAERAQQLNLGLKLELIDLSTAATESRPGHLQVVPQAVTAPVVPGKANPGNANYVLECLNTAVDICSNGQAGAMVTGPIHKASIIDAGYSFSGHTEYLANRTNTDHVVMMLASDTMRVALATTHVPVSLLSELINQDSLRTTISIVHAELQRCFGLSKVTIGVCGLNPHAGEQGHIGREEIDTITPVCDELRAKGMSVLGPLPADTIFTPKYLRQVDVVLAMYHDQGLPVIKHSSFGSTVNVTLGLPIIRTSVDHGTALDLAATGKADSGSLLVALNYALRMAQHSVEI